MTHNFSDKESHKGFLEVSSVFIKKGEDGSGSGDSGLRKRDVYRIFILSKGMVKIRIDGCTYDMKANDICFISPRKLCRICGYGKGIGIVFSEELFNNMSPNICGLVDCMFFSVKGMAPVCNLPQDSIGDLTKLCRNIGNHIKTLTARPDTARYSDYLGVLLSVLVLDIEQFIQWNALPGHVDAEYRIYMDFLGCVEQNFRVMHTVKAYAREMSVSGNTLNKCVAHVSDRTPSEIINLRILAEAKRLLRECPEMQIKEVAYHLGFDDDSNFVKFFKKHAYVTPSRFRGV